MRSRFGHTFGNNNPEEILAGEFLLCQGLRFSLDVKHPFRALRGAIMELGTLPDVDVRLTRVTASLTPKLITFIISLPASTPPRLERAKSSALAPS